MAMSLDAVYRELLDIPGAYGWNNLLGLIQHQLTRGESTSKHLSYYAMRIIRRHREEQALVQAKASLKRSHTQPSSLSEAVQAALTVSG